MAEGKRPKLKLYQRVECPDVDSIERYLTERKWEMIEHREKYGIDGGWVKIWGKGEYTVWTCAELFSDYVLRAVDAIRTLAEIEKRDEMDVYRDMITEPGD